MAEEIIISIKTSTTLTPIPVDVGLHDLLEHEWKAFFDRETKLWQENVKLFMERKGATGKTGAAARAGAGAKGGLEERIVIEGQPSSRYGTDTTTQTGGDECCADQFALSKSLQGLLGQRLQGIVRVELSWKVWNAPEEARVDVSVKDQYIHQGPYLHYPSKPLMADTPYNPNVIKPDPLSAATVSNLQSYPLAMNQPHEGSLVWTVNDHAPAVPDEVGDYVEFVVAVYRPIHTRKFLHEESEREILAIELVRVLMPRARP